VRAASEWLSEVVAAERRGELLTAFDLAERGLAEHPRDVALRHRAVLELARAGSTAQAAARFREYGLGDVAGEDVRSLEARIAKDVALAADGERRRDLALHSAALYEAVFRETGGYYPGINAATLRLVAGDAVEAERLARRVLGILVRRQDADYYALATEAEALLLVGDVEPAAAAVERAAGAHDGDFAAVATTRRQLRLVCELRGVEESVLAPLAGPLVVHYCGHRIGGLERSGDQALEQAIAGEVARARPAYAYGSLAAGADILWAEALLASGCDLHVVLPFRRDEFVETSVADAGTGWTGRFANCLDAATEVSYATEGSFLGDDVLYRYCSELAMGLALLRARFLDAEPIQLAVWDGAPGPGAAGTAVDVATWQARGLRTNVVALGARSRLEPGGPSAGSSGRVIRALLFGDVQGFSQLEDQQLPAFAEHVLGSFAQVLEQHGEDVLFRNTWGDGIYVVLSDAAVGARCALALQAAMSALDFPAHGLPTDLGLRLAGHVAPVFPVHDPVLGTRAFMGSHVSRTARVEPVTPPGVVYVTEAFAAALELVGSSHVAQYVGHMPAAKDFGRLRMYRLSERSKR
jgi:hypothetical protein